MQAIEDSKDQKERNSLTVLLAFVRGAHPDTICDVEKLIDSSNTTTDPLILTYGALATSVSSQLQHRIIQFLRSRMNDSADEETLVHLIHAMGNTEINTTDNILIALLMRNSSDVRQATIYALRYSITSQQVQDALSDALRDDSSEVVTEMVLQALISSAEFRPHANPAVIGERLFDTMLAATEGDIELRDKLVYYVKLLGPRSPPHWITLLAGQLQKRSTRWNENRNAYNLIESFNTRSTDLKSYPLNKAYLWGRELGKRPLKLDIAFGAFAGFGGAENPTSYKLLAKGVARAYAFGHSKTAFEVLVRSENKPGGDSIQSRVYLSIVGIVLLNKGKDIPTCKSWTFPLYRSPQYQLLGFTYAMFIYVGLLRFTISMHAQLSIDAAVTACIGKCVSTSGELGPSVTVTATAGTSASLAVSVYNHYL